MKYLLTLIPVFIILGCDKAGTQAEASTINKNFTVFLNTIPSQPLPLELSCGLPGETKFAVEFKAFQEFIPKSTDRIFGTIGSSNQDYNLIIFGSSGDDIYPIIFSYDNKGAITDSLSMILHPCGAADEFQIPHSFVSISNDHTITLTDTTRFIHIPENQSGLNYIVDSVRVSKVLLKLSKNGKFEKM